MRRRTFIQSVAGAVGALAAMSTVERTAAAAAVVTVTQANFDQVVTRSRGKMVVFFHAPWNATSRKSLGLFTQLAGAQRDGVFGTSDTTAEQALVTQLRIKDFPVVIVFHDGKEVRRHVGAVTNENWAAIVA